MCVSEHVYHFSQTQKPLDSQPNTNKSSGPLWFKPTCRRPCHFTTQAHSLWSDSPLVEQRAESHRSDSSVNHVLEEKGPFISAFLQTASFLKLTNKLPWVVREAVQSQCQHKRELSDPYHTPKDGFPHGAIRLSSTAKSEVLSCVDVWYSEL